MHLFSIHVHSSGSLPVAFRSVKRGVDEGTFGLPLSGGDRLCQNDERALTGPFMFRATARGFMVGTQPPKVIEVPSTLMSILLPTRMMIASAMLSKVPSALAMSIETLVAACVLTLFQSAVFTSFS